MILCSLLAGFTHCASGASSDATNAWWALRPLQSPPVPQLENSSARVRNPIDAFVQQRLAAAGLSQQPEADKRTLLRRISFDLIGLPPTPEEIQEFLADKAADAYEKVVTRLLESPRYGERWARHWIDVAHFAETHGHDQDRIRTNAWPYRDYLITSFNADKPYSRFAAEQVAGDALYPDEPAATVALGLIAAGPWDESSLRDIREDTIDRQIGRYLDRDDMVGTVMQTFTSLTVQCARCHDHKFDPISQKDYYSMQAVFAGVERANRVYDPDSRLHQRRQELLSLKKRVDRSDRALLLSESTHREIAEWERTRASTPIAWKVLDPQVFLSANGTILTRQEDGSLLASGPRPDRDTYTITAFAPTGSVTAIRLEVLTHDTLPHQGPGRMDNGNLHLSELQLRLFAGGSNQPQELALVNPLTDFNQGGWTIQHAVDGDEKTAWGIHPKTGQVHQAIFELKEPVRPQPGAILVFALKQLHGGGHLIGRPRLSITGDQPLPALSVVPADLEVILQTASAQRSEEQRIALAGFFLKDRIARELRALPKPSLVYAAASDFEPDGSLKPPGAPRPVHVLKRGEVTKPGELAPPGALSCVQGLRARFDLVDGENEGTRRAALARWLTDPNNPLTWRSIVNRVWHHHFGRGLVDTPNDFGRMGAMPSHPELLDWLAVWFRDQGGLLKPLHQLIVTSAVYRQRTTTPEKATDLANKTQNAPPSPFMVDGENRLLWRMNRVRLDAEQVRDTILQISQCLDLTMGGPSDMHFDLQPGHHVTPKVDYTKFNVDAPGARRRGIYRFLFRTLPDPFMDALDCPAGDQLTPVRNASVTVQQALAMWNNAFVANYAGRFAARLETLSNTREDQIKLACELTLGRPPTAGEIQDFAAYSTEHGLANLCRLILNSNEFMFVN